MVADQNKPLTFTAHPESSVGFPADVNDRKHPGIKFALSSDTYKDLGTARIALKEIWPNISGEFTREKAFGFRNTMEFFIPDEVETKNKWRPRGECQQQENRPKSSYITATIDEQREAPQKNKKMIKQIVECTGAALEPRNFPKKWGR